MARAVSGKYSGPQYGRFYKRAHEDALAENIRRDKNKGYRRAGFLEWR